MANEMRTYVIVKSEEPKVTEKLRELFTPKEGKYEVDAVDLINRIKGTDYSYSNETTKEDWDKEVDFPYNDTWEELIGPKWLYVQYEHEELAEDCNIVLRSAWSVPVPFLMTLIDILTEIDEDCYIKGTYEDESYDPSGAYIYAKDYDDMEDYDEPFDWDEYEEDDLYTEHFHDQLNELENDLEMAYFEYLSDRKANPENYE